MEKFKQILASKPRWVVLLIFAYIVILGLLKWRLKPDISTILYLLGGLFGVYFLDVADVIFDTKPSPFQSIIFMILFGIVSFFVVTSSGSMFAAGLVLAIYFSLLLMQAEDWQEYRNLDKWYRLVKAPPSVRIQQWIVLGIALLLVIETLLFILSRTD